MALRVIGAGIGRTGTASLKTALEQLGFDKCYHMSEIPENPSHIPIWIDAADGKSVDWDALFEGYQAGVDLPVFPFYKELMAHYPDAKVILTLRDPDVWYESASQTILRLPPRPLMPVMSVMSRFVGSLKPLMAIEPVARKVGYEYTFHNDISKANAIKVFNQHNEEVKQTVPQDRLLIYDVKDGWEPLCKFLDIPVPDAPFPRTNTREEFNSRASK